MLQAASQEHPFSALGSVSSPVAGYRRDDRLPRMNKRPIEKFSVQISLGACQRWQLLQPLAGCRGQFVSSCASVCISGSSELTGAHKRKSAVGRAGAVSLLQHSGKGTLGAFGMCSSSSSASELMCIRVRTCPPWPSSVLPHRSGNSHKAAGDLEQRRLPRCSRSHQNVLSAL